jgi:hypothetical protein
MKLSLGIFVIAIVGASVTDAAANDDTCAAHLTSTCNGLGNV